MKAESDPTKWLPATSALQLQRPEYVYFGGEVRPWDEAVLHVSTEAVVRGLNVFEGLKGYWQENGDLALRSLPRHFARMERSARLLHIPVPVAYEEFERACFAIAQALARTDRDLYIRATLFVVQGHYGEGTVADLVLTGYQLEKNAPAPIEMGVT